MNVKALAAIVGTLSLGALATGCASNKASEGAATTDSATKTDAATKGSESQCKGSGGMPTKGSESQCKGGGAGTPPPPSRRALSTAAVRARVAARSKHLR